VKIPVSDAGNPNDFRLIAGIPVTRGPYVVLSPFFAATRSDLCEKIDPAGSIEVSRRSVLIVDGTHIRFKNLKLDGALIVEAGPDTNIVIDGLEVENESWELSELDPSQEYPESVRIRGYTMSKHATKKISILESGSFVVDKTGKISKL
jgi:UDP-sugar pyrophosphorylase